ncbi:MAG: hypothetical protein ABI199_06585 [Bacteroidia bacterium]
MKFAITKQPALILSRDSLINNNVNDGEYKWTEIKEISLKFIHLF